MSQPMGQIRPSISFLLWWANIEHWLKPRPRASDVLIRQIPDCEYCFRLWLGPASLRHYYLDFVLSSNTAKPFNSLSVGIIPSIPFVPGRMDANIVAWRKYGCSATQYSWWRREEGQEVLDSSYRFAPLLSHLFQMLTFSSNNSKWLVTYLLSKFAIWAL